MASDDRSLSEVEFIAFDLETTGLFPMACRIVEFGGVRFRLSGEELGRFQQLVDPECPIPPSATRIHGITDAEVRGMPTVPEVLPQFLEFLGGPGTILLAHNAVFDLGFLGLAMTKLEIDFPANPVVDTLDLARQCVRGVYSYRLEDVAIHLGVADVEEHRALADSRLVMGVFLEIVGRSKRVRTLKDLFCVSPPFAFADSGVFAVAPPKGYEDLGVAMEEGLTIVMVYEGGTKGLVERKITPRALVQSGGRMYLTAYCHIDHMEKTYRLDRIREFRVEAP